MVLPWLARAWDVSWVRVIPNLKSKGGSFPRFREGPKVRFNFWPGNWEIELRDGSKRGRHMATHRAAVPTGLYL